MWSAAIAAGIPNETFWELSAPEVQEVLKRREEQERRENLRVGLIASTIVNVKLRKGAAPVRPEDWFPTAESRQPATVEELEAELKDWAADHNANVAGAP